MTDKRLFPAALAARYRARASQPYPYRPSNGSEGEQFEALWCATCARYTNSENEETCRILNNTMVYSVSDPRYPAEWQYNAEGQPCCRAYEAVAATGGNSGGWAQLPLFPGETT